MIVRRNNPSASTYYMQNLTAFARADATLPKGLLGTFKFRIDCLQIPVEDS